MLVEGSNRGKTRDGKSLELPYNSQVFQKSHRLEDPQISCIFVAYSRNLPSAIYGKLRLTYWKSYKNFE
jgi:hypothetical protein